MEKSYKDILGELSPEDKAYVEQRGQEILEECQNQKDSIQKP